MRNRTITFHFKSLEFERFNYGEFAIIKSQAGLSSNKMSGRRHRNQKNISIVRPLMRLAIMSILTYNPSHE